MPSDTSPTSQPPRGLAAWREALLQVRLPLLSSEDEVRRLLSPQVSLREAQNLADADPPLALDLLSLAAREPRLREGIRSLQQALNVIGIQRTQNLLRARLSRPVGTNERAQLLSRQAMATSQLAALFAQGWGRQHRAGDEDHRSWLTRLMGMVRWKLPWAHPAVAAVIEARVAGGERRALVERELLGCDLQELNAWHLQDLGVGEASDLRHAHVLPTAQVAQAARLGWTEDAAPEIPPALARSLHLPTTGCALAYALALELQTSWYSARARQWLAVASAHLSQPMDRVRQDLLQWTLIASQDTRFNDGLNPAAARLLWPVPPARRRLRQRPASLKSAPPVAPTQRQTPPPTAAPAPVASVRSAPPAHHTGAKAEPVLLNFEQRCQQTGFDNLAAFMSEALSHLHQDMGLLRCALFLKQAGSDLLVCYVAHGFDTPIQAREIQLPLTGDGVVSKLMQHPSATLWIRPQQVPAARSRLPAALAQWTTDAGCLLGTVQVRSHAMGLWWADAGSSSSPINEARLTQFGRMTQVFGAEFTRLLHLQRERKLAQSAPGT